MEIGQPAQDILRALVGRTFLMDPQENGERYRTKILEALVESEEQLAKHPNCIKFICSVNNDMCEEVLTYNEILEYIMKNKEQDDDQAIVWKFKRIAGHQGPLKKGDPRYNGSKFNVLVEWETGESTYKPLDVIAANDPALSTQKTRGYSMNPVGDASSRSQNAKAAYFA